MSIAAVAPNNSWTPWYNVSRFTSVGMRGLSSSSDLDQNLYLTDEKLPFSLFNGITGFPLHSILWEIRPRCGCINVLLLCIYSVKRGHDKYGKEVWKLDWNILIPERKKEQKKERKKVKVDPLKMRWFIPFGWFLHFENEMDEWIWTEEM